MSASPASDDPFAPVVVRSAAAQVADRIVASLREGRIQQHERLPAERDLAQRLGVSRPTLREALAALELAGIVQSRQGHGTIVIANASRVAGWGVEITPSQVFEARLTIEPALAQLAAAKRYPEDIAHLEAVGRELEAEFAATRRYETDLPVHRAIARAARNPILERALGDALEHTEHPQWVGLRARALVSEETREGHVDEVRRVIGHIARGEGAEAAAVWRAHLEFFRREMLSADPPAE